MFLRPTSARQLLPVRVAGFFLPTSAVTWKSSGLRGGTRPAAGLRPLDDPHTCCRGTKGFAWTEKATVARATKATCCLNGRSELGALFSVTVTSHTCPGHTLGHTHTRTHTGLLLCGFLSAALSYFLVLLFFFFFNQALVHLKSGPGRWGSTV